MTSMLQELSAFLPLKEIKAYLASWGEPHSVMAAIWRHKLAKIMGLFDGDTNEDEEDQALALLLQTKSADELLFLVRSLSWNRLDSELDEPDLDNLAQRLVSLLNHRDYVIDHILERFLTDRYPFNDITFAEIADSVNIVFAQLTTERVQALIDGVLGQNGMSAQQQRNLILNQLAAIAMRSFPTHARELKLVLDLIRSLTPYRHDELDQLGWEIHYSDLIGKQLERAEVHLIMLTLPDLVDTDLSVQQRVAFFEMLRRWQREFDAMEKVIEVVGSTSQKGDMKFFVEALTVFLDHFTPNPPTPTLIQDIASFFGSLADTANGLRVDTLNVADHLIDSLTLSKILGTADDDEARAVTNALFSTDALVYISAPMKLTLMQRMLDGATLDEDELSILHILQQTKEHPEKHSTAEFLQLVAGAGYEILATSFDGVEQDQFMNLMASL